MKMHVQRARAAIQLRKWDLAQESLGLALADDPNNAVLHVLQCEVHFCQRDYIAATDSAREAISLEPEWSVGYYWLTFCLMTNCLASGDAERLAAEAAHTAIACDPNDPDNYYARSHVARFGLKHEQALDYARQGLSIDPEHLFCLRQAAQAELDLERNDAAETTLRRILSLEPESTFAHDNLARVLLAQGRRADAYEHVKSIIRKEPDNAEVREIYGEVVRHQHPIARWLLVSGDWWYSLIYVVIPLGFIPLLSLKWFDLDEQSRQLWAIAAVLWMLLCSSYALVAGAVAEGLIAYSARFNQLLPETRGLRWFYALGVLAGVIALCAVLVGVATQKSQPILVGGNILVAGAIWYFARSAASTSRRLICLASLAVPVGVQVISLTWRPMVYGGEVASSVMVLTAWALAVAVPLKVSNHEYGR